MIILYLFFGNFKVTKHLKTKCKKYVCAYFDSKAVPSLRRFLPMTPGRETSFLQNDISHTTEQAACPGIVGKPKTMLYFFLEPFVLVLLDIFCFVEFFYFHGFWFYF